MCIIAFDLDTVKLLMNIFVRYDLLHPSLSLSQFSCASRMWTEAAQSVSMRLIYTEPLPIYQMSDLSSVCWYMEVHQGLWLYRLVMVARTSASHRNKRRTGRACSSISIATDLAPSMATSCRQRCPSLATDSPRSS